MRDYSKISPQFWNGKTGKALKARGPEAVIVGLYLLTCQHANMLGLYFLSKAYIAADTGLGMEGACKGLDSAIEAGFCRYDDASEVVWVMEMAGYQVGEKLEPRDNRCKGVQREYDSLPDNPFLEAFFTRYGKDFCMETCRSPAPDDEAPCKPAASPSVAPLKPGTGAGERTGAGTGAGVGAAAAASPRGSRLPADWALPASWGEWALSEFPSWNADFVRSEAAKFADFWHSKSGRDATKVDWNATWRNWCRNARPPSSRPAIARPQVDLATKNSEAKRLLGFDDEDGVLNG